MEAEVRLYYENEREAEAVAKAVSPDNMNVPSGLFVETTTNESEVLTQIRCDLRLQTFIATIDDLELRRNSGKSLFGGEGAGSKFLTILAS